MGLFGILGKKDAKVRVDTPAPEDVLQTFMDVEEPLNGTEDDLMDDDGDEGAMCTEPEGIFATGLDIDGSLNGTLNEPAPILTTYKNFEPNTSENVMVFAETGGEKSDDIQPEEEMSEGNTDNLLSEEFKKFDSNRDTSQWYEQEYTKAALDFMEDTEKNFAEDVEGAKTPGSTDSEPQSKTTEVSSEVQPVSKQTRKQKIPALVACFPRTHIAQVENYLLNRYVSFYECYSDVDEIIADVHSRNKELAIRLFVFDFVNNIELYRAIIDLQTEGYGFEMQVITSKAAAASNYAQLGAQVYCVQALMDFLSLMWDSPAFDVSNVLCAAQYNMKPVEYAPLAVKGLDISKLSLDMKLETVKAQNSVSADTVYQIKINNKISGVNIRAKGKKKKTLKDYIQQFLNTDVVRMTLKTKPGYLDNIKSALSTIDHYYTNMGTCMYDNGFISKEQCEELNAMVRDSKISGICAEAEQALKLGWISEFDFLETCRQYFNVEFLDRTSVLKLDVLQRSFGLEACKHYKCFVTTGPKRDISYIVVDISNKIAIAEIGRRFDQYELLYTRSTYIEERLASLGEAGAF